MQPLDYRAVLDHCAYPGFNFVLGSNRGGDNWLQVQCYDGVDNITGLPVVWNGRKWRLSPHMTASELVQTAFLAVLTAVEHEVREKFHYRSTPVFDPHYDVERLVELRRSAAALDVRG